VDWKKRFALEPKRFRVGLVWAGSPVHKRDRQRSISLSEFLPLVNTDDVEFYSLQKGPASQQAKDLERELKLIDYTAELKDFADTAALISQLDLIIGVDTAVIHLAAAMGKPTWFLAPSVPDWRWLMNRDDSPWYPTARLFRQKSPGEWKEVFGRVAAALADAASPKV